MTRHALLVGCQTFGLRGCENDIRLMAGCLARYGFAVKTLIGEAATRRGILDHYRQLIGSSQPGDAVVFFYSGHGGIEQHLPKSGKESRDHQFLVPVDFAQSKIGDFRGIADLELSVLQTQLTAKTQNLCAIFDCCHAARISRQAHRVRTISARGTHGIPEYSAALKVHISNSKAALPLEMRDFEANPHAVRLVAAGVYESAFEYSSRRYGPIGFFTEALADILHAAQGHRLTWYAAMARAREWVLSQEPLQRPGLEGPGARYLFETQEAAANRGPIFFYERPFGSSDNGQPSLRAGFLSDVVEHDVYALVDEFNGSQLRLAKVTKAGPGISRVVLSPDRWIAAGTPTVLLRRAKRQMPVCVKNVSQAFLTALKNSPFLKLKMVHSRLSISVIGSRGLMVIHDQNGTPLTHPVSGIGKVIGNLEKLAKVHFLQRLESGAGPVGLPDRFALEWGRVKAGARRPYRGQDELLFTGDRIYVAVQNNSNRDLWVNIINVGVGSSVMLLTRSQLTTGVILKPNKNYCLGACTGRGLVGQKITWPQNSPANGIRIERLIVIISSQPQDLTLLETGRLQRTAERSVLQAELQELVSASNRSYEENRKSVQYAVRHLCFSLSPQTRAVMSN